MEDIIYINFIDASSKSLFSNFNNKITITINYLNEITLFQNNYDIYYDINKTINNKKYFINIPKTVKEQITTSNFTISLPKYYYFQYGYYNNENYKSIIIYKNFNYLPLIYLGLPNFKSNEYFKINYKYNNIDVNNFTDCSGNPINCNCDIDCSGNYDGTNDFQTTLFNNYFGNDNYFLNTLKLPGDIYQICINNNDGIIGRDNSSKYKLFKIKNNMDVDSKTNIYFYDDTSGNILSYIIHLNTYNFYPIKNSPTEYENIIININYLSGLVDSSGSVYNTVLSLNMETFNPNQLCQMENDVSGNFYYNTLFFKNYVNSDYYVDSINIFDYDYDKYFVNTENPIELYNINYYQYDLYDLIISPDTNLSIPIILNITEPYLFMNLDYINLNNKLIKFNYANDYFYKFTKSNKINLEILEKYLINFTIKKYNVFEITNIRYNLSNDKNERDTVKNNLYINETYHSISYLYKNPNEFINFNNNIVNCIRCKIVFYYSSNTNIEINGLYSVDTKIFLSNYNLDLYNKKYNFENITSDEEKKKLINMLLFLQTTTYKIKLYFYNKKNSVVTSYYIFNQVDLIKNDFDFNTIIDLYPLNNNFTEGYLKLNILINKEYYILFLYSENGSFLDNSNFDELIFLIDNIVFKIFKINKPNGNIYENKILFYIVFQNLKELNIFMNFIKYGKINTNYNSKLSNYFNIPKSITFYNYYDLNYYWVSNYESLLNKYEINFSINNLYVNQIYLYGDLFIECL